MYAKIEHYQVVIAGFGPVGQAAAIWLGRAGIKTLVIEKSAGLEIRPRAISFCDETFRAFASLDVTEEVRSLSVPAAAYRFVDFKHDLLIELPLGDKATTNGFPRANSFFQPDLEAVLAKKAMSYSHVTIRFNEAIEEFDESAVGVRILSKNGSGFTQRYTADYLLGCDGARSTVRRLIGSKLKDLDYDHEWLVVDGFRKPGFHGLSSTTMTQICGPRGRPTTFIPSARGHLRWEFKLDRGETAGDFQDEATVWRMLSPWVTPDDFSLVRSAVYRFHALVADRWNTERVFLAGDSAHQTPPFLGQGMCSGIRDAINVSWKLESVIKGNCKPSILDTYQVERSPHTVSVIRSAIMIGRLIQTDGKFVEWVRNTVLGLASRYEFIARLLWHDRAQLPGLKRGFFATSRRLTPHRAKGSLIPNALVRTPTKSLLLLDELLGNGFAILSLQPPSRELLSFRDRLKATMLHIVDRESNEHPSLPHCITAVDHDGSLHEWMHKHGVQVVIVRPDRYIFAAGDKAITEKNLSAWFK
jgi:3-(3-hydroxy-phenyl)propionate hydroxylase